MKLIAKSHEVKKGLTKEEVVHVFTSTDDLDAIARAIEGAEDRLYVTWASVEDRDSDNELIPINDVINSQDTLLKRGGIVQDVHSNRNVGQTLAYKVLQHPEAQALGVLHLNEIYADYRIDDKVWKEIQSGERKGSSVGGTNSHATVEMGADGRPIKVLHGFEQHETSTVYQGANPWAENVAVSLVAKSKSPNGSITTHKSHSPLYAPSSTGSQGQDSTDTETNKTLGENTMSEQQANKQLSERLEAVAKASEANASSIAALTDLIKSDIEARKAAKEEDEMREDKPTEPESEEKKKADTKKEDASSEIEGEQGAESPEDPGPEDSNEFDTMKALTAKIDALTQRLAAVDAQPVKKSTTPRPHANAGANTGAPTVQDIRKSAVEIGLGKKKSSWGEVHKLMRDHVSEAERKFQELARTPVA